ncbi:MAG: NADP-dependent oxidoreductase, partial [Actinomycetales bacterium]|nr:NADP-dependent oxidoreductase [Actinomycetales bacterium]
MTSFRSVRLAQRPTGIPSPDTWAIESEELPALAPGEFAVGVEYISLDPAMRGWIDDRPSYLPPVELGSIMRAGSVGTVTESLNANFAVGAQVVGTFGATEVAISDGSGVHIVRSDLAPLPTFLGALGMTGMTAYFGLFEVGKPRAGDVVVVSAAAGAVGSIVGQIAKING